MVTSQTVKVASPKKKAGTKSKAKSNASHPPTAVMVAEAMKMLKDRKGSTLQAIKKAIAGQYAVDTTKSASYIRKAMNAAIEAGSIVVVSGTGLNGRFKVPAPAKEVKAKSPSAAKKKLAKKAPAPKAKKVAAQEKKTTKSTKAKRTTKPPTKKPKAPKPKKAATKSTPKKKSAVKK